MECSLTGNDSASDSKACFEKPVRWDIISGDGRKLAGAGQRRGREGVLHQGSVAVPAGQLAGLGQALARELDEVEIAAPENLSDLIGKYAAREWLERVP